MKLSWLLVVFGVFALVLAPVAHCQSDDDDSSNNVAESDPEEGTDSQAALEVDDGENAEADDAAPSDETPEDDEDSDDDDDDESDASSSPVAADSDVLASSVESSPCGCKGRVKNPGDEFPFDVKCQCDIEKPDYGRLPSLKVSGQTELNGLAYLGYAPFTSNLGKPMQSGFYQAKGNKPGRVPDQSHPWMHLINVRHSNIASNHQLQIGSSYAVNDRVFVRKIATSLKADNPEWNELAMRSGSNVFQGQQTVEVKASSTNGNTVGLELYAEDQNPPKVNTQHPSIRFHHAFRFWHRLEGRRSGLHSKVGKEDSNNYSPMYASSFRSVSDARAKRNVEALGSDVLTSLRNLKAYKYDLVGENYKGEPTFTPALGLIAQELMNVIPEAVHVEEDTNQHSVDYSSLAAATTHGLKELLLKTEAERDELSSRVSALEATVQDLIARVSKLEKQ